MTIHMIWATSADGYIGKNGKLPWYLPEDLQHFKNMTDGKTVVMGRKTWESLGCRPLPNRRNVILSKQYGYSYKFPGLQTLIYDNIHSLMRANPSFWVIGGQSVYREFMPYVDHLVKTEVDLKVDGDVIAPGFFPPAWRLLRSTGTQLSVTGLTYRIMEYVHND